MQELSDSIKRPNLRSWALKEKRCKPKRYIIYSIKKINRKYSNLEKVLPFQVQEAFRTPET
jgi:hypothetical protein